MTARTLIVLMILFPGIPLASMGAHHSFAAEFDAAQRITIEGIVTKVEWTNPHVWFFVNVQDSETGEVINWGAEMGSPNALARTGWAPDTMQVGMRVTVAGSQAKDGSARLNTRNVMVGGRRLGGASSEEGARGQ